MHQLGSRLRDHLQVLDDWAECQRGEVIQSDDDDRRTDDHPAEQERISLEGPKRYAPYRLQSKPPGQRQRRHAETEAP